MNLAFSSQAAYAAPLILPPQTRGADRDKAHIDTDLRHRDEVAQYHIDLLEQNTELTQQVADLTDQVADLTRRIHERVVETQGRPTGPLDLRLSPRLSREPRDVASTRRSSWIEPRVEASRGC